MSTLPSCSQRMTEFPILCRFQLQVLNKEIIVPFLSIDLQMLPRTEIKERLTSRHYREIGDTGSEEKSPDAFE